MHIYALRLQPNTDLRIELENLCKKQEWSSAWIVTCVGSLRHIHLRMAGAEKQMFFDGPLEITSLVGTLCQDGVHLHITVSNKNGAVFGGHLCRESKIFTTAEIVIGYSSHILFKRLLDDETGYDELFVEDN
jgi:uncharacterized protein